MNFMNNENKRDLARDESGAILIMGLAMILGLVAFLWFLLGIGETLAFRDHMQEAADSAAFTQPAVEALCMNLIVLINIIMMVMVALYILGSIIVTASWASSLLCCPVFPYVPCCVKIPGYISDWNERNSLASDMATAAGILSPLESIIGMAAPWAGTGISYLTSSSYKMSSMTSKPIGIAFSKMNLEVSMSLGSTQAQFGLPVTHDFLGNDCTHIFEIAASAIGGLMGSKGMGSAAGKVGSLVGSFIQWYYCDNSFLPDVAAMASDMQDSATSSSSQTTTTTNPDGTTSSSTSTYTPPTGLSDAAAGASDTPADCSTSNGWGTKSGWERWLIGGGDAGSYWNCGKYGPMMDVKHGKGEGAKNPPEKGHDKEYKNGADMMQSYALLFVPNAYSDHHATHNIQMMQLHNAGWSAGTDSSTVGSSTAPKTYGYYAQGELYFDCDDNWAGSTCDDGGGTDMVMYKFEWRARLVKVHFPGGLGQMMDFLNTILGVVSSVRGYINGAGSNELLEAINFLDPGLIGEIGSIADPIPATLAH